MNAATVTLKLTAEQFDTLRDALKSAALTARTIANDDTQQAATRAQQRQYAVTIDALIGSLR